MASGLQYKNKGSTEDGYSNGISSGMVANWTDTNLNGSHEAVFYWDDAGYQTGTVSRVYMTVKDSWTGTRNADNSITLHLTSSYTMTRQPNGRACNNAGCPHEIGVFPGRGYNDTILQRYSNQNITASSSHSFSRTWTKTLAHGQEMSVGTFFVINCTRDQCSYSSSHPTEWSCSGTIYRDNISSGTMFRNTLPAPPYNPSVNLSCGVVADSSNGRVDATVSDWGCPGGGNPQNNCHNSLTVQWSTDSSFSNIIATGTGIKGLTPNTKYWVRAIASNGYHTTTKTCSFTTLATSYPYGYKFLTDQVSWLYLQINNGSNACDISTKLFVREKGTGNWQLIDTTTSEVGIKETLRNLVARGKRYESYSETTNCAGTYHSPIYEFAPPAADSIVGVITSYSATLQPSGLLADLDYCYRVTSYTQEPVSETNPITSRLEYSLDKTTWIPTDNVISTKNPDTICGKVTGLMCSTTYYLRSYQEVAGVHSYSAIVQLTTPTCAGYNNCVCGNLNYMTELICQQLARLKTGVKTIYANCDTKEICDPYSNNPTIASILSRLLRFSQAVECLICSMEALNMFKSGGLDQVFTASTPGTPGQWITLDYYPNEGSENLVASSGVAQAIQDYVESVFHPIGSYEYYAEDMAELDEQSCSESEESDENSEPCIPPTEGDRAIIGENYYTYTDGEWELTGRVPDLADFGVVSILKGTYVDENFYWWNEEWQLLDVSGIDGLEERIEEIEEQTYSSNPVVQSYDSNKFYKIATVPYSSSMQPLINAIIPDGKYDVVVLSTVNQIPSSNIQVTMV